MYRRGPADGSSLNAEVMNMFMLRLRIPKVAVAK